MAFQRTFPTIGYLILSIDGAVLNSGGELENDEDVARTVTRMLRMIKRMGPFKEKYSKITVTYKMFRYEICCSNRKIYVKKVYQIPQEKKCVKKQIGTQVYFNNIVDNDQTTVCNGKLKKQPSVDSNDKIVLHDQIKSSPKEIGKSGFNAQVVE